jgi:hypothetical protein
MATNARIEQKEMEQEKEARRTRRDKDGGDDDKPKVWMDGMGWDGIVHVDIRKLSSCGWPGVAPSDKGPQLTI